MNNRLFSLEPLTLPDVSAIELIKIAAETGYGSIGMVLNSPVPELPADAIVNDLELRKQAIVLLKKTAIVVTTMECFNLTPDVHVAGFERSLACGRELGVSTATTIIWENGDRKDVLHKLRRLCDMAHEHGIHINIEFMKLSKSLGSLQAAAALVRECDRPNVGIMVDLLHLMRSGGSIAELHALDSAHISGAQICDGFFDVSEADMLAEAGGNRRTPGEGVFPIAEFVDALPRTLTIGIEVPQIALIGKVAPLERARRLLEATRCSLGLK